MSGKAQSPSFSADLARNKAAPTEFEQSRIKVKQVLFATSNIYFGTSQHGDQNSNSV